MRRLVIVIITACLALAATAAAAPEDFVTARSGDLAEVEFRFASATDLASILDDDQLDLLMAAAADNPHPDVIEFFLRAGIPMARQTPSGWTALMYAVRWNPEPEVTRVLLAHDLAARGTSPANALLRNADGNRAIDLAPLNPNPAFLTSSAMAPLQAATTPPPTAQPAPAPPPATRACCRVCTTGKACGDSCIARSNTCRRGAGCACNAATEPDIGPMYADANPYLWEGEAAKTHADWPCGIELIIAAISAVETR